MAKTHPFLCTLQRYEELCDMYAGKTIDYAIVSPGGKSSGFARGEIRIGQDLERTTADDEVWVTMEVRPEGKQDTIVLLEDALPIMRRGSGPNEAEWVLDGDAPTGVAEADV